METKLDRIARRMRPTVYRLCLVALPIVIFFYMNRLVDLYHSVGPWTFVLVGVSTIIVGLAASMLVDDSRENR